MPGLSPMSPTPGESHPSCSGSIPPVTAGMCFRAPSSPSRDFGACGVSHAGCSCLHTHRCWHVNTPCSGIRWRLENNRFIGCLPAAGTWLPWGTGPSNLSKEK